MSYNKIIYGNEPILDLTSDTATPSDVLNGVTFIDKSGTLRTGTATINVSVSNETLSIDGNVKNYTPCDFATGDPEDIAKAIEWHHEGIIDLRDYWGIGTERVISIPAIPSAYGLEAQPAQNITFSIMNYGGKELTNPIGEQTECTLVLGMKNVLSTGGIIDSSSKQYRNSARRTWCNNNFYNAIPSDFRALFKQFKNPYSGGSVSDDYFSPFACMELTGNRMGTDASSLIQFSNANVNKSKNYWTRTNYSASNSLTYYRDVSGNKYTYLSPYEKGCYISLFGVL